MENISTGKDTDGTEYQWEKIPTAKINNGEKDQWGKFTNATQDPWGNINGENIHGKKYQCR